MPPGDCEILRPFCCPADGAAMGAAAPGRDMGKESKEGAAGRGRAGRRGQGDRLSRRERGDRLSRNARISRQGRGGRAWRECRSPRTQGVPKPCPLRPALPLPAWCLSFSFVGQHARARLLPWLRVARLFAFVSVFARKYAIYSDL